MKIWMRVPPLALALTAATTAAARLSGLREPALARAHGVKGASER